MQPVQITYHGVEASQALTELVEERSRHISQLSTRIDGLRVLIDSPHHHHRHGNQYRVRLELTMPKRDLVIDGCADEDPYMAVRQAFGTLQRRLTAAQARRQAKQRAKEGVRASIRAVR